MHLASLGAFANALPFGCLLRVRQPFLLVLNCASGVSVKALNVALHAAQR